MNGLWLTTAGEGSSCGRRWWRRMGRVVTYLESFFLCLICSLLGRLRLSLWFLCALLCCSRFRNYFKKLPTHIAPFFPCPLGVILDLLASEMCLLLLVNNNRSANWVTKWTAELSPGTPPVIPVLNTPLSTFTFPIILKYQLPTHTAVPHSEEGAGDLRMHTLPLSRYHRWLRRRATHAQGGTRSL